MHADSHNRPLPSRGCCAAKRRPQQPLMGLLSAPNVPVITAFKDPRNPKYSSQAFCRFNGKLTMHAANVMDRSIGIDIPVCLGLTLVKQTQFHLSQLRMSRVGHLHGLIYDDSCVLYYGIYGVCIGILACRGLSLVSSPLHAMKSQSQIQSSAAVNLGV
ncbi:hypothetical protein Tco_0469373 [Tanacetum coccineum]